MRLHYLENTNKIFNNGPVIIVKLIPSQFQGLVSSDIIDSVSVFEYKLHHVIGQVPSSYHIVGDKPLFEVEF